MWQPFGKRERRLGGHLGVEVFGNLAALLHLGGARREIEQRDAAVGADHAELAGLVFDVRLGGFEHVRGDGLALAEQRLDGLDHGVADRHGGARADRGVARDLHRRIAVPVFDLLRLDAEPLGHHRVEDGGVALPGRLDVQVEQAGGRRPGRRSGCLRSEIRRHVRACRKCRARDTCRAWRPRAGAA